jgi:hypothetical protein
VENSDVHGSAAAFFFKNQRGGGCFFLEEITDIHKFVQNFGIHKCNNHRLYGFHRFILAVLFQCSNRGMFEGFLKTIAATTETELARIFIRDTVYFDVCLFFPLRNFVR